MWGSLEIGVIAVLVALLVQVVGRRHPRLSALLWSLVFLKACIVFVPLQAWQLGPAVQASDRSMTGTDILVEEAGPAPATLGQSRHETGRSPAETVAPSSPEPESTAWSGLTLSGLWVVGGLCALAWQVRGYFTIVGVRRKALPIPEHLQQLYGEEAQRCGVRSPPALVINNRDIGPLVTGGLSPQLFLPSWLLEDVDRSDLRWVLRHELMHIRHLDHLGMVVQSVAGILFWFHPAIWWAAREWRRKMEQACDDAVAESAPEARRYAATLYHLLEKMVGLNTGPTPVAGLYATRTVIGQRIERLLQQGRRESRKWGPLGVVTWSLAAAGVVLFGFRPVGAEPADPGTDRSTLRIDLGPDGQKVEPGWEGWSEDRDRDFVCGFDLDFEIEIEKGPAWRDNGSIDAGARLNALMRDGLRERDDDEIRITIKDLDPGEYVLELFSYTHGKKTGSLRGRFDLVIDGSVVLEDQVTVDGGSLIAAALPPVPLESNGEDIEVTLRRQQGDIWLNGFALSGRTRWPGDIRLGKIKLTETPPAVEATIEREIEGATLDDVRRKVRDDALIYSIDADTAVGDLELEIAADGTVLERSEDILPAELPLAIRESLAAMGEGTEIREVRRVHRDNLEVFEVEVRRSGDRETLVFNREGRLLSRDEDD